MSTGDKNQGDPNLFKIMKDIKADIKAYFMLDDKRGGEENKPPQKKMGFNWSLAMLLFAGICMLLLGRGLFSSDPSPGEPPADAEEVISFDKDTSPAEELASQLEDILEDVTGVDQVSVMITMDTSSRYEYALDSEEQENSTRETDSQGGEREVETRESSTKLVLLENSQGGQSPVLIQEQFPRVRGVVVVGEGVNSPQVESWIVSALQALLDIPAHKISVLPRGN